MLYFVIAAGDILERCRVAAAVTLGTGNGCLQSFAYQTAVALLAEVICPYLFRRQLTATGGQTSHPEGQALLGDKVWNSLRIRWIEVALARLDIHHSGRSDSIWGWITPDGRGGYVSNWPAGAGRWCCK